MLRSQDRMMPRSDLSDRCCWIALRIHACFISGTRPPHPNHLAKARVWAPVSRQAPTSTSRPWILGWVCSHAHLNIKMWAWVHCSRILCKPAPTTRIHASGGDASAHALSCLHTPCTDQGTKPIHKLCSKTDRPFGLLMLSMCDCVPVILIIARVRCVLVLTFANLVMTKLVHIENA